MTGPYRVRWWHPRLNQHSVRKFTEPRAWQEATRFHRSMQPHGAVLLNSFGHIWTGQFNPAGLPIWTTEERAAA